MRWITIMGLALVARPLAGSAQLRPVPLDSVRVEVDSRAPRSLGAAARAVEVITAEVIAGSPATTVSDVLRWAFGVELMPRSPALADVAIRGSSFEQVLVLVDGVRMRDAQTGHFNLNLAVPLDQVDRIEVLRGPAASLYGSDAMAGVINVVTRGAGSDVSARVAGGSFETADLGAAVRMSSAAIAVDAAATYQDSEGHRAGTDYEMAQARLAVSLPAGANPIRADVAYSARDFGAGGFYGDFPSFESTRTTVASVRWRAGSGSAGRVSLEPLVSFRRNSDDFILYRDEPDRYRSRHTTDQFGGEVIGRWVVADGVAAAFGVHAVHDEIRSAALGDHAEWTAAGSTEVVVERGRASASGGVRLDRLATGGTGVSPSVAILWQPMSRLRLRSSAGRSFRAPTWTERYYRDPANVGNPDLGPETAWSVDAGLDAAIQPGLRFAGTVFLRSAEDLIDWARDEGGAAEPWVTRNVESAEFRGLETEITAADVFALDLALEGAWISLDASAPEGVTSKYALRPRVEYLALSADRAIGGFRGGFKAYRERRSGERAYTLVDLRAAVQLGRVRVHADVRNLFDETYDDITFNTAAGRNVLLGLEWRQAR